MAMPEGSKILVNAPVVRGRKGEYSKQLEGYRKAGYARAEVDGIVYALDEEIKLDKNVKHNISVVVDRLVVKGGIEQRLTDSLETALKLAEGLVVISCEGKEELYSTKYACPVCNISIEEIEPRLFSFNNPFGACPDCAGLGFRMELDEKLVVPNRDKSLREGAMTITGWNLDTGKMTEMYFTALAKHYHFSLDTPVKDLPAEIYHMLLYGNNGEKIRLEYATRAFSGSYEFAWEGIIPNLARRYRETTSDYTKSEIEKYMTTSPCETCRGKRLKKEALSVLIGGKNIAELCDMPVDRLSEFIGNLGAFADRYADRRFHFKGNQGAALLPDGRRPGLSDALAQRGHAIGRGGAAHPPGDPDRLGADRRSVYFGRALHRASSARQRKTAFHACKHLRDLGNSLIVVEHDEDTMRAADYIVDIGPYAGIHGGEVVACGTAEEVMNGVPARSPAIISPGGGRSKFAAFRQPAGDKWLTVVGAAQNNLKHIDVSFPVGLITAVTGVSGSGKSSLVNEIVYPVLATELNKARVRAGAYRTHRGN